MRIAIISTEQTDFEDILSKYADTTRLNPYAAQDLTSFDAFAVLGGTEEEPLLLPIDLRLELEAMRRLGKPVFAEWCQSIGYVYGDTTHPTVSGRMVYIGSEANGLCSGDLLDDHANSFLRFVGITSSARPILVYGGHITAHDHIDPLPAFKSKDYALWQEDQSTVVCAFRLCNYVKARFTPQGRWDALISQILTFLIGRECSVKTRPLASMYHGPTNPMECFRRGLNWFDGAKILIDNGNSGVLEGLSHCILPDGTQLYSRTLRNDCAGEVGGAFFFDWYLNGSEASRIRYENLQQFCFEKLYEDNPPHRGLMRWSSTAWGICYQDDVARTILGTLLAMQLTGQHRYLDKICAALDYLLDTTGSDGLRISRTDAQVLTTEKRESLHSQPSNFPCAHHNGYYLAVLLLTYGLTGKQAYFDTALRGIENMMAVFPNTIREHSETQELCRLILPLACLYEITKKASHKEYLDRVTDHLEQYWGPYGGYLEHDTGYKAERSRTCGTESSLLADNGDPVVDLLYSVNWLPLGFAYSYKATGDHRFFKLWQQIAEFLSEVQIESQDPQLDGSWCRCVDTVRREAYGMPHDVGWGPCAVESGWTVGEILMGLGFGISMGMAQPPLP